MPKPQNAYLRDRGRDKTHFEAKRSKSRVAINNASVEDFYNALCTLTWEDIGIWRRAMAALADELRHNRALSKSDRKREAVSKFIGDLRENLEKIQARNQFQSQILVHAETLLSAPRPLAPADVTLPLVIAALHIFEVVVRMRLRGAHR
jgi:hypothetical protein